MKELKEAMQKIENEYWRVLKFERLENYKSGRFECPVVKVTNINGNEGYLAPFRFYSMQISGTYDGEWSFGASVPREFDRVYYRTNDEEFKEYLKVQIIHCLNSYLDNRYGYPGHGNKMCYTLNGKVESFKLNDDYLGKVPDYECYEKIPIEQEDWVDEFLDETIRCFKRYYR